MTHTQHATKHTGAVKDRKQRRIAARRRRWLGF
jgi:hypothetical protein